MSKYKFGDIVEYIPGQKLYVITKVKSKKYEIMDCFPPYEKAEITKDIDKWDTVKPV